MLQLEARESWRELLKSWWALVRSWESRRNPVEAVRIRETLVKAKGAGKIYGELVNGESWRMLPSSVE